MESASATGLVFVLVPVVSLAIIYWHWRHSKSAMGYFVFSMYVLDSRRKYLTSDPADISLYDLPEIKRARAQCLIGIITIVAMYLVIDSWPPCRILYNCAVAPSR